MNNKLELRLEMAIDLHNLNRAALIRTENEEAIQATEADVSLDKRFEQLAKGPFKHVSEKYGSLVHRERPTRFVNTTLFDSRRAAILLYGGRSSVAEFTSAPHDVAFHTNPYMALILTTAGHSKLVLETSQGWGHLATREDITNQELSEDDLAERFVALYEKITAS
jgi:hypothetical protein